MEIKGMSQMAFSSSTEGSEINQNQSVDKSISKDDTTTTNPQDVGPKEVKEADVKKAVDKLNKFLEDDQTHAEYDIHPVFKDLMIKIVDDKTGDVLLEIPPKKILDVVAKMCEMVGIMIDKKA